MPSFSQTILNAVTSHYLSSGDFNGTAISSINGSDKERLEAITEMVSRGQMSVEFGDVHPNARIKAFPSSSVPDQLTKLGQADLHYACVYPSASHLAAVVDQSQYAGTASNREDWCKAPAKAFPAEIQATSEEQRTAPLKSEKDA